MKKNQKRFVISIIIIILLILSVGVYFYIINNLDFETQNYNLPEKNNKITNEDKIETFEPQSYTSSKLGITFQYIDAYKDFELVSIIEKDNKIIVEDQTEIVVFNKNSNTTLKEAIEETFLKNYDPKNCWVKLY